MERTNSDRDRLPSIDVAFSAPVAATAHLIARVVYRMLKYQVEYQPLSVGEYEKHYRAQQIKYLQRKAAKLGFLLSPAGGVS